MGVRDPRDLPAFRRWFEGSKVLDDQGRPLVMFHGTPNSFSKFSYAPRKGLFFFTLDADFASDWAEERAGGVAYEPYEEAAGPCVMPVYIAARNPWDYKNREHVDALISALEDRGVHLDRDDIEAIEGGDWMAIEEGLGNPVEVIKDLGHDAIWMTESSDIVRNLAVFRSEQIKSAIGNVGAYDPESPDIRHSMRQRG